jgi:hypothetical protein
MTDRQAIAKDLDRQILDTQERFSAAMKRRLPKMDLEQKEQYFALLSNLVGKLEKQDKSLKQVLQEVVPEVLPLVMQQLSGG